MLKSLLEQHRRHKVVYVVLSRRELSQRFRPTGGGDRRTDPAGRAGTVLLDHLWEISRESLRGSIPVRGEREMKT